MCVFVCVCVCHYNIWQVGYSGTIRSCTPIYMYIYVYVHIIIMPKICMPKICVYTYMYIRLSRQRCSMHDKLGMWAAESIALCTSPSLPDMVGGCRALCT